jgi:hypothetical protein
VRAVLEPLAAETLLRERAAERAGERAAERAGAGAAEEGGALASLESLVHATTPHVNLRLMQQLQRLLVMRLH